MHLLDGRKVAEEMLRKLEKEVNQLKLDHIHPKLGVILVGQDPASLSYIRQKQKACAETGVEWEQFDYMEDVTQEELIEKIEELNKDDRFHGILVQLPLPKQIYTPLVTKAISPLKDVDGFTAYNLGKVFLSTEFEYLAPCTPMGVIRLLEYYNIDIKGQDTVVVGHSNIVGKPLSIMLANRDATVTTCHVHTRDLAEHTRRADILCVAVGKPGLVKADMVKDGVVVVDVGVNRTEGGKLVGDVDFANVRVIAGKITPNPGGVGPMTIAMLMSNTVRAAEAAG